MLQNMRFGAPVTPAIKKLIIINVAVFLVDYILINLFKIDLIRFYFALIPEFVVHKLYVWQIISYSFLHDGFFHIIFNMLMLWMFGAELEIRWGTRKFYQFYLICGILTGIIILIFNLFMENQTPALGASGIVYALLLVYAIYWGDRIVYMWMLFPIKIKYLAMILGAVSFLSMLNPAESQISHIGHLGGLLAGYIYLKLWSEYPSTGSLFTGFSLIKKIKMFKKKREWERRESDNFSKKSEEEKVDEILQKISQKGIKSLKSEERRFLKKVSEKMNKTNIH